MKKVIHSPSVGQPKSLTDYSHSVTEGENISITERVEELPNDFQMSVKKAGEYQALIAELREDNKTLVSAQQQLKDKYDILCDTLEQEKLVQKNSGYAEGIAQAKAEIESAVEQRVSLGETLLNEIKKGILAEIYDQEGICLEIIYSAISRLIADSAGSKEQIKSIVKLTMEKVASQDNLQIYLSPEDYKLLKDDAFIEHSIIQSDELEFGGCVIKTGKGTVEAKLEEQLAKLKQLLLDIHKAG